MIIFSCAEGLSFFNGDRSVAFHQFGENAALSFDTQRQWRNIEQQHVVAFTCKYTSLDGCTDRHDFVRVHTLVWLLAEELLDQFIHFGDAGRPADQDHFIDICGTEFGVRQSLRNRFLNAIDERIDQFLELRSRDCQLQVLGA